MLLWGKAEGWLHGRLPELRSRQAGREQPPSAAAAGRGPAALERHSAAAGASMPQVHSSFKPIPQPDYVIPVEIEGRIVDVYVLKRPFVDHFLRTVGHRFEVGRPGRPGRAGQAAGQQRGVARGALQLHSPFQTSPPAAIALAPCRWLFSPPAFHRQPFTASMQVVVFTASLGKYADPLLDLLDKVGG